MNSLRSLTFYVLLTVSSPFLLVSGANAEEAIPVEKVEAIRELMQVTGAGADQAELIRVFTQQMLSVLKLNSKDLPDTIDKIVEEEVTSVIQNELANESLQSLVYPIYARYFTTDELRSLAAFYKTPAGQKANRVTLELMQESRVAAQAWSQSIGPALSERVLLRLRNEGIEFKRNP